LAAPIPSFGQIPVVKGSAPLYAVKFTGEDGNLRDVSAYPARFQAYKADGSLLFPEKTLTAGIQLGYKAISFLATDLALFGSYKAKLFLDVPGNPEAWIGTLVIGGY